MSIRIRTSEELTEKLDSDTQWRKKEIVDMQIYCRQQNSRALLRAAFILCCAHFEGSIKYASNAYIAYISSQEIKGKDLRIEISSIAVRKKKHLLFGLPSSKKVKISVVRDVLNAYDDMLENNFYIKLNDIDLVPEINEDDMPLPTEGNPSPDVLAEISGILGLNYDDLFLLRAPFINSELLNPRNAIAHGERRPITPSELDAVTAFVLDTIDKFKISIVDAAINNRHLRNP